MRHYHWCLCLLRHISSLRFAWAGYVALTVALSGTHARADNCIGADIYVVAVNACLNSNNFEVNAKVGGQVVARGYLQDHYVAESGQAFYDEAFTWFSVPGVAGSAIRVKVRILKEDRNDGGIFSSAGDVIYAYAIWNIGEYINCPIPRYGNLDDHCWDHETGWIKMGNL